MDQVEDFHPSTDSTRVTHTFTLSKQFWKLWVKHRKPSNDAALLLTQ